ncbi:MAG: biotin--[acetyl-CoA-carboxylase] ligase [Pseudomonadota bacterium]
MTLGDGTPVHHHAEIDSTNAEAARLAASGAGPLWVLADRQTKGRARRGRSWSSLDGNLFASYLCRPNTAPERAALATFATSLAVADLATSLLGGQEARITLKWPNDVHIDGRKAAGILLESSAGRDGRIGWLVIGIGINLVATPPDADIRTGGDRPISIAGAGGAVATPLQALRVLSPALTRWLGRLEVEGFAPIRRSWLARAARRGKLIGAGLAAERLEGIFEDVDETGALVLKTADGALRQIPAADIYFPD